MISFQHILFPVDFSAQCAGAAPFVRDLAERFHSRITLMHIVEVPPAWYGPPEAAGFDALVDLTPMLAERRAALESFQAKELPGLTADRRVETGAPAPLINEFARRNGVDLIMMPTHGYGPFRSLLLGSVTAKVLHDAECPVWTAAHASEITREHLGPWRKICCAVDSDPRDLPLIRWAAELAASQHANLRLVHIVAGCDPAPNGGDESLREFLFNVARDRMAKLQEEAGTNFPAVIEGGRIGRAIRDIAERGQTDLLLVGRGVIHKPLGRLRSNAYAILRNAPCPVISL